MPFPILNMGKMLLSFPRRWFQDNLQSGVNKWGIFIPALQSGPGGSRQGGTCPARRLGRTGPGYALRDGGWRFTHHALLGLDEGPAEAVHLAVEAAGVAQVVAGAVPPPERRLDGAAVHTLATLGQVFQQVCREKGDQRPGEAKPRCAPPPGSSRDPQHSTFLVLLTRRPRPSPQIFLLVRSPLIANHSLHPRALPEQPSKVEVSAGSRAQVICLLPTRTSELRWTVGRSIWVPWPLLSGCSQAF